MCYFMQKRMVRYGLDEMVKAVIRRKTSDVNHPVLDAWKLHVFEPGSNDQLFVISVGMKANGCNKIEARPLPRGPRLVAESHDDSIESDLEVSHAYSLGYSPNR